MTDDANNAALLEVLRDIRNEMRHQRALLVESIEQGRTLERAMDAQSLALHQRIREVKEELEQTIKGEMLMLIGALDVGQTGEAGGAS
jgi:hypoxanthine-guanine phosphoribosyltransferase